MKIQCECGQFQAEVTGLPRSTAGRFVCYCDDCQTFAHALGKAGKILDSHGGTEVCPVYPPNLEIRQGLQHLRCLRLSPKGAFRWYAGCCRSPIANSNPKFPWAGVFRSAFQFKDEASRESALGPVLGRIQGRFGIGELPKGTSRKMGFRDFLDVGPFLIRGFLTGKHKKSPFFDSKTLQPVVTPEILPLEERQRLRALCGPHPARQEAERP